MAVASYRTRDGDVTDFIGLSTDIKPTTGLEVGARFTAEDTGAVSRWTGSAWVAMTAVAASGAPTAAGQASAIALLGLVIPGARFAAIVPDNSNVFPFTTRAIWVGVSGDITADGASIGTNIPFKNVPVGWFIGQFSRVYLTGTSATNLVATW